MLFLLAVYLLCFDCFAQNATFEYYTHFDEATVKACATDLLALRRTYNSGSELRAIRTKYSKGEVDCTRFPVPMSL